MLERVDKILLEDIIDAIAEAATPTTAGQRLNVVMKLDIETLECRAILASQKIFSHPKVAIPYLLIEWYYVLDAHHNLYYG